MTQSNDCKADRASFEKLRAADGSFIAYNAVNMPGAECCYLFCGGFRSDMEGSKALHVEATAMALGQNAVRFDYFGHGVSSGDFTDGSISRWRADTLRVIDKLTGKLPIVIIGSSMGGWIGLLAALARPERVVGYIGLAAAPDFTRKLMWANASEAQQLKLMRDGKIEEPNDYSDEPYVITRHLIEDGDQHQLLDGPINLPIPVRLIHGLKDTDVPLWVAERCFERLESSDATLTLVKSGDHRLSEPCDLVRLGGVMGELLAVSL